MYGPITRNSLFKTGKSIETESRLVVTRGLDERKWGWGFLGAEIKMF